MTKPLGITDVTLRDAHQSLLATRFRIEDMLPMASQLDAVGFWSLEVWGGATFDSCIRYLGEDPWERLRTLKKHLPKTPLQMLLRGQNLLGYRHYADDVVERFVARCADNGMDVFRIFDAMNDTRNLQTAVRATIQCGKHAQGTISYTTSPVHTTQMWLDMARELEDMGCHSICIKDMAGLLKPYVAEELVSLLKESISVPIALHSHATTGMSTTTLIKAAEAGIDMVDAAISSMSLTYGHTPIESIVATLQGTERDTGLALEPLEEISAHFRGVRKQYARFEGSLQGVDSRILLAQVPGGMLTNMENQLREQNAADRLDEVLAEIPKVREELGFIPLVTPTSQIVGTQAVINVLMGERYKTITKETAAVLKGEYGRTAAPVDSTLQARVLEGSEPVTCRPADLLTAEMDRLTAEFTQIAREKGIETADDLVDDVLIYALFPQVGLKFLQNRGNADAFEPHPGRVESSAPAPDSGTVARAAPTASEAYHIVVNGTGYDVVVSPQGAVQSVARSAAAPAPAASGQATPLNAPLAGNIFKILVQPGQRIESGEIVVIMEAMKMETEVRATASGTVASIAVKEGDAVDGGSLLLNLA